MTDRELLESAARAALMWKDAFSLDDEWNPVWDKEKGFYLAWGNGWWNPLTDDGDVLRLAVKLRISPSFGGYATEGQGWVEASYPNPRDRHTGIKEQVQVAYAPEEMFHNPRHAKYAAYLMANYGDELVRGLEVATRRAIVRAAAAIGAHKEGN